MKSISNACPANYITPDFLITKQSSKSDRQIFEKIVHGIFLILGLITVLCVLLISIYLIVSGIPAIRKIGLIPFLFGTEWASTASTPKYGILPFILTSAYGTAGGILLGVPVGFLSAVYLSKIASRRVRNVMQGAVNLLAGIPSVVYGLVGMFVLVPGIRKIFQVPDSASLLASILVPAVKSGITAAVVLGVGRAVGEAMAVIMVAGNAPAYFREYIDHAIYLIFGLIPVVMLLPTWTAFTGYCGEQVEGV